GKCARATDSRGAERGSLASAATPPIASAPRDHEATAGGGSWHARALAADVTIGSWPGQSQAAGSSIIVRSAHLGDDTRRAGRGSRRRRKGQAWGGRGPVPETMTREEHMIQARKLGHIVLKVRDAARSRDFYTQTLGLTVAHEDLERGTVFLSFGREHHELALFQLASGDAPGAAQPGLHHMAWQLGSFEELQAAYRELK